MIRVYINSCLVKTINDPKNPELFPLTAEEEIAEAWNIVGNSAFGACYECHNEHGIISEFIPF